MNNRLYRWWLTTVTLTLATIALPGCMVYQIDRSELDQSARAYHQTAPFKTDSPVLATWLTPQSEVLPSIEVVQSPSVEYNSMNAIPSILTLSLIPFYETTRYTDNLSIIWEGETLAESSASYTIKNAWSLYFPTPLLFMGSLYELDSQDMQETQDTVNIIHARNIADAIARQQPAFEKIPRNDPDALVAFVTSDQAPLFKPQATAHLATLAPPENSLEYHQRYLNVKGYINLLPVESQAWLIGPDGLKGWQIKAALDSGEEEAEVLRRVVSSYPESLTAWHQAARQNEARFRELYGQSYPSIVSNLQERQASAQAAWPYYPNMTEEHHRVLVENGIPANIVAYMTNAERSAELVAAAKTGSLQDDQGRTLTEEQLLERLVRNDNDGRFMSPFTSDGVLAEWVNLANNANMGATAGSAVGAVAGAYAANKALDFVPFGLGGMVGGAAGAKVGKEVGRETAISASGGWEAIRASSDQSFNSLNDMARYLKQKYGSTANFADAVRAATQIYPDFSSVLDSTY